ncbi:MAG: tetratricopeptide repeat protein [Acidobacteriota bacterium]
MTSGRTATAILIAATILAYVNSFGTAFQFDDRATILQDRRLSGISMYASHVEQMIRPLLKLSFLVDRQLYGTRPAGYHLLNLLFHCGSGLLLFAILTCAGRHAGKGRDTVRDSTVPFFAALFFLLHPIATETVTYISGRATGMAAFFSLLSLYLFLRAVDAGLPGRGLALCYSGALLSFMLALLAKEIAIILPGLLLLWQVAFRPVFPRGGALGWHAPFWMVVCLGVVTAAMHARYSFLAQASLQTRPIYTNLLTQINAVCHALTLFFIPARLNFDHDLPVYSSIAQWPIPVCLALLGGLLGTGVWCRQRRPSWTLGILWFFICLLPANSVIPRYDVLSERNLYLPSIGVFLIVALLLEAGTAKLSSARPSLASILTKSICVLVAVALLAGTVSRNRVYANQVTFWSDAVRKSPHKARPHNNLGYALYEAGDVDGAINEFRIALSLNPASASARENLQRVWKIKHPQGLE